MKSNKKSGRIKVIICSGKRSSLSKNSW